MGCGVAIYYSPGVVVIRKLSVINTPEMAWLCHRSMRQPMKLAAMPFLR
jgi:hypothetical protein